nr:alpha/beta hydrolase [Sphingopyxis macrogoltabida]
MLDADLWSEMRAALADFGRAIDIDTAMDSTIDGIAARALRVTNGPALVIGFSMGGYVARQIAYKAPHRICGLALVATSSRGSESLPSPPLRPGTFRELSRAAVARSLHPDHRSEALIVRVQDMSRRLGGEVFARQTQFHRDDDTARLGEITCPTLVVAAAQDELRTIDESRTLHEHIPGSLLTVIEHSGHLIPLEQPGLLIAALRAAFEPLLPASS